MTLKENFNTGCFVPSEGTTQLLLNPHFRNKMQQFIYEMKFIIIVLNVTNGTFIHSSGQPFKKFAPFSQSNRVVSFCKVSLMFDRNTFRWGISRGHCANEVDMLIFRRYFGSEAKGIKVRTVIKIRDNPGTKTWPRKQTITTNYTK